MNKEIDEFVKDIKDIELELKRALSKIGNLVHDSVPVSKDEVTFFFISISPNRQTMTSLRNGEIFVLVPT
jgi:seryl-tRNA synthetase